MTVLNAEQNFSSLSLTDLLEARELFHIHLMNKANVVGTAVGRYLIRKAEEWPTKNARVAPKISTPRTFANSEVRPYSWPCVLALVSEWIDVKAFGADIDPTNAIPRAIYMPDGRTVPICVVLVEQHTPFEAPPARTAYPDFLIGGGFPLSLDVQGVRRNASVGCLVSDGHSTYALTNRHVVGDAGTPVFATLRGERVAVGEASALQLSRLPFTDAYDQYPGQKAFLTLDAGLVLVNDATQWTSKPFGLSNVTTLGDINETNLGLHLIDQPVQAFGATSGELEGQIKALFYRYKSIGSYDYISDFLIAPTTPRGAAVKQSQPGDSGTVWHLRIDLGTKAADGTPNYELRPFALQWGGQGLLETKSVSNYALATNLATICRLLNVDLAWGNDPGAQPFWGATGHFSIGRLALEQPLGGAARLLIANHDNIAFSLDELKDGRISKQLPNDTFVPLADVADIVWKKKASDYEGGRDVAANTGPEHPNHFADADEPNPARNGQTLREFSLADPPKNLLPAPWFAFYQEINDAKAPDLQQKPNSFGLLPFRVWQIYDQMVAYAKAGQTLQFVAAAGVIAHYVGDACQPLHGSWLADGYGDQATHEKTSTGKDKKVWPGQGVHAAYEDAMIDKNATALFAALPGALAKRLPVALTKANAAIVSGADAALAVVTLMDETAKVIPPVDLINAYIKLGPGSSTRVTDGLWSTFGAGTATVMSYGIHTLAAIWQAAWKASGKPASPATQFTQDQLDKLVWNPRFLPSYTLQQIASVLMPSGQ
jgi:hypothetical protein